MDINDIPRRSGARESAAAGGRGPFLRANPVIRIGGGRRSPLLEEQRGPKLDAGIMMGQGLLKAESMRRKSRRAEGGRRRPATSAVAARSAGTRRRRGQGATGNATRNAARSSAVGKGATAASVLAGKPVSAAEVDATRAHGARAPRNQSSGAQAQRVPDAVLNQAVPADALAPLLLVDTNCPFRASVARHFENELTNSFPLPLSQYPRDAVVYSHKEASSGRLIVQLRYLPSVPGPHFGGTDEPAAFCELLLSSKQLRSMTHNIRMQLQLYLSGALGRYFGVRADRYYLRFMDRNETSKQSPMLLGKASISGTELMSQESLILWNESSRAADVRSSSQSKRKQDSTSSLGAAW